MSADDPFAALAPLIDQLNDLRFVMRTEKPGQYPNKGRWVRKAFVDLVRLVLLFSFLFPY
jgi:hypothetical protein